MSDEPETPDGPTGSARRQRRLPVGPLGLLLITIVALAAATAVVRIGLGAGSSDAVDVQDALDEQAAQPLVPPGTRTAQVGRPAPDVRLKYLDGGVQQLSDLRGRPVVVNFWASTCAPCRTEMPALDRFRATHEDEVTVVGVAVADPPAAARAMVARTAVSFRSAEDPDAAVFRAFGGTALPRTVIVDAAGIVRETRSGALDEAQLTATMRRLGLLP